MSARWGQALTVACLMMLAACGSTTPDVSLSGTWVGTEIDTVAGTGTVTSIITQNGSNLTGTYSLTFNNPIFNNSGTLSGSIDGLNVKITATPSVPTICAALDTGTVNSAGTTITGNYAVVSGCSLTNQMGSFSATKQ